MKKLMKQSVGLLSVGLMLTAVQAFAQTNTTTDNRSMMTQARPVAEVSEYKPHVGVLFGASHSEGGGDMSGDVGIDVGYQPYIPFGLGAEYIHSKIDTGTEYQDRDTLWLKGTYNFAGDSFFFSRTYAGVGVGAVIKSADTSLAAAPIVGFDLPMGKYLQTDVGQFTVGGHARYAIVNDNEVDALSVAGAVKFWY